MIVLLRYLLYPYIRSYLADDYYL